MGRSGADANDLAIALAAAIPCRHDEGFVDSRALSREVCRRILAIGPSQYDLVHATDAVRSVLSSDKWYGWHVSFCAAFRKGRGFLFLNCGRTGIAAVENDCRRVILEPQTLSRKLRNEGVQDIPPFADSVAATLAGADLRPGDVDCVEMLLEQEERVLMMSDAAGFFGRLSDGDVATLISGDDTDRIAMLLASHGAMDHSFALLSV